MSNSMHLKKNDIFSVNDYNIFNQELETIFCNILNFEVYVFNTEESEYNHSKLIKEFFTSDRKNLSSIFRQFGCSLFRRLFNDNT